MAKPWNTRNGEAVRPSHGFLEEVDGADSPTSRAALGCEGMDVSRVCGESRCDQHGLSYAWTNDEAAWQGGPTRDALPVRP